MFINEESGKILLELKDSYLNDIVHNTYFIMFEYSQFLRTSVTDFIQNSNINNQ